MGRGGVWVALVPALAGCGRFAFDATDTDAAIIPVAGLVAEFSFESPATAGVVDGTGGAGGTCDPPECPLQTQGHRAGAYLFDGVDDCILVPDLDRFDASTFTLSLWLFQASNGGMSSLSKAVVPNSNSWQIESDPGGRISFTTNNQGSHDFLWSGTGVVRIGSWQHVATTWDGVTKRLFVDGGLVASITDSPIVFDTHGAQIGCDDNIPTIDDWYDGAIDEVQIYDRALSSAEIATLASM